MTNKLVSSNFIGGKCQYLKVWDKVLFRQTSIEGSVIYPIYIYIYIYWYIVMVEEWKYTTYYDSNL